MAEVQADTLRVRAEASTEAEIRTLAADGSQLQVLDESIPGWVKVRVSPLPMAPWSAISVPVVRSLAVMS